MFRALMFFAAGWWFGRNRQVQAQLVAAGQQILDAETGTPIARSVLPNTTIVSPEQAAGCPQGYTWWPQYQMCLDPLTDAKYRAMYAAGQPLP